MWQELLVIVVQQYSKKIMGVCKIGGTKTIQAPEVLSNTSAHCKILDSYNLWHIQIVGTLNLQV